MAEEIVCRLAKPSDSSQLFELFKFHRSYAPELEKIQEAGFERIFCSQGAGRFIVAVRNSQIVGAVHLRKTEYDDFGKSLLGNPLLKEPAGALPRQTRAIVVKPEFRGMEGRRIILALFRHLVEKEANQGHSFRIVSPQVKRTIEGKRAETGKRFFDFTEKAKKRQNRTRV